MSHAPAGTSPGAAPSGAERRYPSQAPSEGDPQRRQPPIRADPPSSGWISTLSGMASNTNASSPGSLAPWDDPVALAANPLLALQLDPAGPLTYQQRVNRFYAEMLVHHNSGGHLLPCPPVDYDRHVLHAPTPNLPLELTRARWGEVAPIGPPSGLQVLSPSTRPADSLSVGTGHWTLAGDPSVVGSIRQGSSGAGGAVSGDFATQPASAAGAPDSSLGQAAPHVDVLAHLTALRIPPMQPTRWVRLSLDRQPVRAGADGSRLHDAPIEPMHGGPLRAGRGGHHQGGFGNPSRPQPAQPWGLAALVSAPRGSRPAGGCQVPAGPGQSAGQQQAAGVPSAAEPPPDKSDGASRLAALDASCGFRPPQSSARRPLPPAASSHEHPYYAFLTSHGGPAVVAGSSAALRLLGGSWNSHGSVPLGFPSIERALEHVIQACPHQASVQRRGYDMHSVPVLFD